MEENPFSALINMQRNDVTQRQRSVFQTFRISTLLNHSPFTVKIGGIPCSGTELLINQTLLNEETKENLHLFTFAASGVFASASGQYRSGGSSRRRHGGALY